MILITGATGLIGAHLALRLLQAGKPVVALKRPGSNSEQLRHVFAYYTPDADALFDRLIWREGDINDIFSLLDALEGIEEVYHCAGFVSFHPRDRKRLHQINAEGTANVVNACLEKNVRALCHVSSIATLQNPDAKGELDEQVHWKSSPDNSDYAISKYNAEREAWRGVEEGLQVVIVNPGVVIGPGFWKQSSGQLFNLCYKGSAFYSPGSTAYIDARDVATCMVELMQQQRYGQRYVLIENNYAYQDIFAHTHIAFGHKAPRMAAGPFLLNTARLLEGLKSLFTGQPRQLSRDIIAAASNRKTYSNRKVKAALQHTFIPVKESITFSCKYYLNDLN